MIDNTVLIRRLSSNEIQFLKKELIENSNWVDHFDTTFYKKSGALRSGKTTWVKRTDDFLNCTLDVSQNFPILIDLIKQYGSKLGRIYYHKLDPTEEIYPHTDSSVKFINKISDRFQIYFNIPNDVKIYLDGRHFSKDELEFSVVKFALKNLHWYKNLSNDPLIFCVFDILK